MLVFMQVFRVLTVPPLLFAAACLVSAQAVPTPAPNDKPIVFGTKNEKPDKSRLRDLKGLVHDTLGDPIPSAIVKVKDLNTGETTDAITKQDGKYLFYDTRKDHDYELTVSHPDYSPVTKKLSQYDTRKPATINFELEKKKS
jgi:hypothetical protein